MRILFKTILVMVIAVVEGAIYLEGKDRTEFMRLVVYIVGLSVL